MAIPRNDVDERQARIDRMIAEFRAARERRLLNEGMALWTLTEMALGYGAQPRPPRSKPN